MSPKVHTLHTVKSAVALKWQVEFKNDIKMTPIVTIIFDSEKKVRCLKTLGKEVLGKQIIVRQILITFLL